MTTCTRRIDVIRLIRKRDTTGDAIRKERRYWLRRNVRLLENVCEVPRDAITVSRRDYDDASVTAK
jgi:hypothetical protein